MDSVAALAFLGAYMVVVLVIVLAYYVVASLAHMKALKTLGYDKPWMAWIPFANYYAYAEAASDRQENVNLFGNLSVPSIVYKLWWIAWIVVSFIPAVGTILAYAVKIIFLGNCYVKMYAKLENTPEQDQQVIGYLSGFITLIAIVKFLIGKYDTKTVY